MVGLLVFRLERSPTKSESHSYAQRRRMTEAIASGSLRSIRRALAIFRFGASRRSLVHREERLQAQAPVLAHRYGLRRTRRLCSLTRWRPLWGSIPAVHLAVANWPCTPGSATHATLGWKERTVVDAGKLGLHRCTHSAAFAHWKSLAKAQRHCRGILTIRFGLRIVLALLFLRAHRAAAKQNASGLFLFTKSQGKWPGNNAFRVRLPKPPRP